MWGSLSGVYVAKCIPEDIRKMLSSFVEKLKEVLSDDVEVYLFGSYAKCSWLDDSDIDIIVVSNAFRGLDLGKRYALVRKLLPFNRSFEILTYTHEEFETAKKRSIVLQDASEYWIKLA